MFLAALTAATVAAATPAPAPAPVSPQLAADWSLYTPLVGLGVSAVGITGLPTPLLGVPIMAFGPGAGHVYAGDPLRGGLVALGGAAAPVAVGGTVYVLGNLLIKPVTCGPAHCDVAPPYVPIATLASGLGTMIAYWLWASRDAAATAERRNAER